MNISSEGREFGVEKLILNVTQYYYQHFCSHGSKTVVKSSVNFTFEPRRTYKT